MYLSKTTANDWDDIPSYVLNEQFSEHFDINRADNTALPHKPLLKYAFSGTELQCY